MDEPISREHDSRYFHALLQELHHELEMPASLTEDERTLLLHIKDDVDSYLQRASGQEREHDETLAARLQESVASFEITHPALAAAMQRVVDGLSQAGI